MFKNVAAKFMVFAFDTTNNTAKTGDAANLTCYVSKDYGTVTVLADTSATEMDSTNAKGYYLFDAAQGETNGDVLMVSAKSATANIAVIGAPAVIYTRPTTGWLAPTTAGRTLDVSSTGEAGVDWANVGSPTTTVDLSNTTIKTTQKVDVDTIKTNPVVNGGTITFPTTATLASTTNITAGTITTTTNVTTVNGLAANVITAASIASDADTEIANAVWDADATGHQTGGTFGQAIGDPVADTNTIFKATVTDATGVTVGTDTATLLTRLGTPSDLGGGATVAGNLSDIEGQTDDIGVAGAGLTAVAGQVWDLDATGHQTGGTFGQAIGDPAADTHTIYDATVTAAAGVNIAADIIAVKAETASIQSDTNDIQTRLPAALVGGRIDASVGAVAADAITAASIANGAIDAATFAAGAIDAAAIATGAIDADAIADNAIDAGAIASNAITSAKIAANAIGASQLAADAVDEIWDEALVEPGAVPAVTAKIRELLAWLLVLSRNKITQTSTTQLVRDDADGATIGTSTVSDDGVTFTRGEFS